MAAERHCGGLTMELLSLLEAALYYDAGDAAAMAELYEDVLGLRVVARWADGRALRLGGAVVLLFEREGVAERDDPISDHGSSGPGHACFTVSPREYERWRGRIAERVGVVHEHEWPEGRRSFYFRDPAGNLLEIADGDMWPS
jgi:catechol 2,3-dioxygenase-like lactoylglutathione lyase family enzyme